LELWFSKRGYAPGRGGAGFDCWSVLKVAKMRVGAAVGVLPRVRGCVMGRDGEKRWREGLCLRALGTGPNSFREDGWESEKNAEGGALGGNRNRKSDRLVMMNARCQRWIGMQPATKRRAPRVRECKGGQRETMPVG